MLDLSLYAKGTVSMEEIFKYIIHILAVEVPRGHINSSIGLIIFFLCIGGILAVRKADEKWRHFWIVSLTVGLLFGILLLCTKS